jgi:hypothetical protein
LRLKKQFSCNRLKIAAICRHFHPKNPGVRRPLHRVGLQKFYGRLIMEGVREPLPAARLASQIFPNVDGRNWPLKTINHQLVAVRAWLKSPERGCVVLDQPQPASNSRRVEELATRCGWSSTPPRSFFRQALEPRKRSLTTDGHGLLH